MTRRRPRPPARSRLDPIRSVFNDWAATGKADRMADSHQPAAGAAFERLDLAPDAWYLDIGCGTGYTVRWAAARAPRGKAIGIDAAGNMIARARKLSDGMANVELIVSAFPPPAKVAERLPPARFDGIFSMEVFYYLPDLPGAMAEVFRLLKPGGRFVCVVDYYGENTESHDWPRELGFPLTLLDAPGWADLFRGAGFRDIDQNRFRLPPGPDIAEWQVREGSLVTLGVKR